MSSQSIKYNVLHALYICFQHNGNHVEKPQKLSSDMIDHLGEDMGSLIKKFKASAVKPVYYLSTFLLMINTHTMVKQRVVVLRKH